jgi:MFS family permease
VAADRRRWSILAFAWAGFVLAVYCPDIGRGFVKDDFTWIRAARTALAKPSTFVVPKDAGFYRRVVAASFAIDYAVAVYFVVRAASALVAGALADRVPFRATRRRWVVSALPAHGTIVLRDEPHPFSTFRTAFGDLTTEALQTAFGRPWSGAIVDNEEPRADTIVEYRLVRGRVVPQPPAHTE